MSTDIEIAAANLLKWMDEMPKHPAEIKKEAWEKAWNDRMSSLQGRGIIPFFDKPPNLLAFMTPEELAEEMERIEQDANR